MQGQEPGLISTRSDDMLLTDKSRVMIPSEIIVERLRFLLGCKGKEK
jgi:hypothetical protein